MSAQGFGHIPFRVLCTVNLLISGQDRAVLAPQCTSMVFIRFFLVFVTGTGTKLSPEVCLKFDIQEIGVLLGEYLVF